MKGVAFQENGKRWTVNKHELPRWLSGKESACNAGDMVLISGLGRSPGERNGNPVQYSCLGNSMDIRAWQTVVHGGHKRGRHDLAIKQL